MKLLIWIFLLLPILSFGQENDYVRIGGTNLSLVPPQGFEPSTNFKGFQMEDNPYAMIMVVEIPGPFSEIKKGFTKKAMAERGMELIKKENRALSSYEANYVEMEQEANGVVFVKSILIYGNETQTVIVNGMCLKENQDLFPLIQDAISTIKLDETLDVDPRSELAFTLNEELINLEFIGVVGNGMLFNRDGNIPTESEDQLNVFVDKSFATVNASDKEGFCLQRLSQYDDPYELDNDKGLEKVAIDGIQGYSLFAKNELNKGETIRQIILFPEDGSYFIFHASYQEGYENTESDVDLFFKSFKVK
ncbi:hypothetical protein [Portibacter lacus]|nr:hypothetical protein [Portibacter lacus]